MSNLKLIAYDEFIDIKAIEAGNGVLTVTTSTYDGKMEVSTTFIPNCQLIQDSEGNYSISKSQSLL